MSPITEQRMDATRFFNQHAKVACVCCGADAFETGGCCPKCHVPLDLSHCTQVRGVEPTFVPVFGASGAGKTVYIGLLLDMLSKGAGGFVGLPNNAFSVAVQEATIGALENRRFPDKTVCESEEWQWVHCEVTLDKRAKKYVDIVTPDLAGEAISMELEHPGSFPAIRSCVNKAAAIIVLVDAPRLRDGGSDEDFFATKLAAYIYHQAAKHGKSRSPQPLRMPLAVTLTKADQCPEALADPLKFARHNMPSLTRYCQRYFTNHHFFAASAVGSVATVIDGRSGQVFIPLHVQPHGIIDPLAWIITHCR